VLGQAGDEKVALEAQNRVDGLEKLNANIPRMQELQRKLGSIYSGKGSAALTTKDKGLLRSLYNETVKDLVRADSGLAATDAEVQRYEKILPFDTFTTGMLTGEHPSEFIAGNFNMRQMEDARNRMANRLTKVDPETAELYKGELNFKPWETEEAQQEIITTQSDKPAITRVDNAQGKLNDTSGDKVVSSPRKELLEDAKAIFKDEKGDVSYDAAGMVYADREEATKPPRWLEGMSDLAYIAGDSTATEADRERAYQLLSGHADESVPGMDPDRVYAAKYYLYKVGEKLNARK
jgi:prolyl oligopeptidase PreP (S9A serine peptidase family)